MGTKDDSWGDHMRLPPVRDPPSDYPEDAHEPAALPPVEETTSPGKRRGVFVPPAAPVDPVRAEPAKWTRLDGWAHYGLVFLAAFIGAGLACVAFR